MTLEAYEVISDCDDRDRHAVGGAQYAQALGGCQDLIAVHVKNSEGVCWWRHPWLGNLHLRLFDSDLPAGRGPGHLATQGVSDHLGSKADTDQLASFPIEPSYQVGESEDPREVFIDRMSGTSGDPRITFVEVERKLAGEKVECDKFDLGSIGKEPLEELRVVAGDNFETGPNMVAKKETEAHEKRVSGIGKSRSGDSTRYPLFAIRLVRYPPEESDELPPSKRLSGFGFYRIADLSLLTNEDRLVLGVVIEGRHSLLASQTRLLDPAERCFDVNAG